MPRYLAPSEHHLRKPTDPGKENGPFINPPRYAGMDTGMGGLDGPKRTAAHNPLSIAKPNGGRKGG